VRVILLQNDIRQIVYRPSDVAPSREDFEVIGAFNPGAIQFDASITLLVRVAERSREIRTGYTALPRWTPEHGTVVDWVRNDEFVFVDPRVVRLKCDGRTRLTFISYLKVIRSLDGVNFVDDRNALLGPESLLEEFGVEDARITPIDGRFLITYVAVSRSGVATALASTDDFQTFTRRAIIFGPENKDVVLFPERIDGQYVALHRPSGAADFGRPEMWLARSPNLLHWGEHRHLLGVGTRWDSVRVGAGPPPLRIPEGWLVIYHGVTNPATADQASIYSAGAVLLDYKDPCRVLARSRNPILIPQTDFECNGFVPNVVFPTGVIAQNRSLLVYYGAADTVSAVIQMSLDDILASLQD
jgi:beta-1,2-mannobiose phosphorylase / 1,2-beta-oligomannan phosphorylase